MHGSDKNTKKLVGRHEGKILRHGNDDNIRRDFKRLGFEVMDWTYLAQNRVHWRDLVTRQRTFEF